MSVRHPLSTKSLFRLWVQGTIGAFQYNSVMPRWWPQQLAPAEGGWWLRHCALVVRGFSICEMGQRDRFLGWLEP